MPPTYELRHFTPRGKHVATYTPNTAQVTSMSLRVTGQGDCRNGVIRQLIGEKNIKAGDWLEVWLEDDTDAGLQARYAGEIRVGVNPLKPVSDDLNLAGGMARLGKIEVRAARVPSEGEADSGSVARTIVAASVPQTGTAILSDVTLIPDTGFMVSLTPYFAPLASALQGIADSSGMTAGVDAQRRVFLQVTRQDALWLNSADPTLTIEHRKVSAENLCTAVRWVLGTGDDGAPLTHLSRDPALVAVWGEHVARADLGDGLDWLRIIPVAELIFDTSGCSVNTFRGAVQTDPVDWTVLMDDDPNSRAVITEDRTPPLISVTRQGRLGIDALKLSASTNARTLSASTEWNLNGVKGRGSLSGLFTTFDQFVLVNASGPVTAGDMNLEISMLQCLEIDRAALDRRAQALYRVPARHPATVSMYGRFLPHAPFARIDHPDGTYTVDPVEELEYVVRAGPNGWWGTVLHIGQREDGEREAVAQAIAERDAHASQQAARASAHLQGVRGPL